MASRIFQSVVVQMKEATNRAVGVIDPEGIIVASSDLSLIGTNIGNISEILSATEEHLAQMDGKTLKSLAVDSDSNYIIFAAGEDELAKTLCIMASIAINEAGIYFEENHDKRAFVKTIISENILPGDIYVRAKELRFSPEVARGVLVIHLNSASNQAAVELLQNAFPDRQHDFVIAIADTDIALIKEIPPNSDAKYLQNLAAMIHERISTELSISSVIGVATLARHLRELAERYKEATISIDIGKVFEPEKPIVSYESLGIGRLIYQLPTTLCEIYLTEVFKRNPIESLDQETLYTIDKFFENSLNVSETSRKLFVHRNTLVYRLDKIRKITGLDLREFDHAIIFKVALMVKKYLVSQEARY
ncbi:MAG: helix-turn-helix domain-containing protein [Oscillospiraceae bacterium]|nr:helix-turn-helix domain-containing protein [Oscillospiraceae bacterium]